MSYCLFILKVHWKSKISNLLLPDCDLFEYLQFRLNGNFKLLSSRDKYDINVNGLLLLTGGIIVATPNFWFPILYKISSSSLSPCIL